MKTLSSFLKEESVAASATTQSSIPTDTGVHAKKKKKKKKLPESDGEACGGSFFDCDHSTFTSAIQGKSKSGKWNSYLSGNEALSTRIKEFRKSHPKKKILLKNSTTGEYMFAHRAR